MPLSNANDYDLTTPSVSPAFPEEAIEDPQSICRVLQTFGGDKPDDLDVEEAIRLFSNDNFQVVFTLTFMQKLLAALKYDWDGHTISRLSKYHPGIDLAEMELLLWNEYTTDILIIYHREDKSLWGYRCDDYIDPDFQLVKLGYKWADIAE